MNREPTKEDLEAKLGFIEAYFDDLRGRIDFLSELRDAGHQKEAMLLCCCYIDGLANRLYWPDTATHKNFVRAIAEFGVLEFLCRIHPKQLYDSIARLQGRCAEEAAPILNALVAESGTAVLRRDDVEGFIASRADPDIQGWISSNLWRGTLASIAYLGLRIPSVHSLGSAGGISFSSATLDGGPAPDITFETLRETLGPLYDEARERSRSTNKWFGHDLE